MCLCVCVCACLRVRVYMSTCVCMCFDAIPFIAMGNPTPLPFQVEAACTVCGDCKEIFYYSILGQCIAYDNIMIYVFCIMIVVIEQFMCVCIIKI